MKQTQSNNILVEGVQMKDPRHNRMRLSYFDVKIKKLTCFIVKTLDILYNNLNKLAR